MTAAQAHVVYMSSWLSISKGQGEAINKTMPKP